MAHDENRLRDETQDYWENGESDKLERVYIPYLLPQELQCAHERGAIEKVNCDVLVLLVGHSMEPLLQAVCAFQPQEQIFLVLNKKYDGEGGDTPGRVFGERVKDLIGLLPQDSRQPYRPSSPDDFQAKETADQPAAVFHLLQENIKAHLDNSKRVIIDITGAKKSMIAGAFLYAAYTGTPISYVDFDRYEPRKGKPFGYTCRIGLLRDPYEAFRLRDWDRVRRLYQSYQFRAAREILRSSDPKDKEHPGLIQWMCQEAGGERYFTPGQVLAVEHLAAALEVYELWENGDFSHAFEKARAWPSLKEPQGKPFAAPLAVRELGPFWPRSDPNVSPEKAAGQLLDELKIIEIGEKALPDMPHRFTIYARDEIAKIGRLIVFNEDYRSALLRSVGLGESLLRARWVSLWLTEQVEVAANENGDYTPMKNAPPAIRDRAQELKLDILKAYRAEQLLRGLRYSDRDKSRYRAYNSTFGRKRQHDGSLKNCIYMRRREPYAPRIEEDVLFDQFKDLRDKAIHTYLSVPKSVAEEALRIARASLDDYERRWATQVDPALIDKVGTDADYASLRWERLCALCGIDFLPPAPADKEAV